MRPSVVSNASYQSPPTSTSTSAGRYAAATWTPGDRGQPVGDDRGLQQLDDAVLGLEALLARLPQPGPLERGRAAPPEVDGELDVGRAEPFAALVADRQHREPATRRR